VRPRRRPATTPAKKETEGEKGSAYFIVKRKSFNKSEGERKSCSTFVTKKEKKISSVAQLGTNKKKGGGRPLKKKVFLFVSRKGKEKRGGNLLVGDGGGEKKGRSCSTDSKKKEGEACRNHQLEEKVDLSYPRPTQKRRGEKKKREEEKEGRS